MAMSREQAQALALARVRRQRAEAENNPGFFGKIDAAVRGAADGLTLGFADEISAGLGAATGIGGTFGDYYGNLEAQRSRDERDEKTSGGVRLAGQLAGAVALPVGAAKNGVTFVKEGGNILSKGLRYGGEGAVYGALSGAGTSTGDNTVGDTLKGGFYGGIAGVAAPALVAGATRAVQPVANAVRNSFGPATSQAAQRIGTQLRAVDISDADVAARLKELGPEAALVDVMGSRGQSLARSASNVSPEARAQLEGFSAPRMATQPDRVAGALEEAAGLPKGNRLTAEGLKEAAYSKSKPAIDAAYDEARTLGFDLPLDDFQQIISSPMGQTAFSEAAKAVQNRMAANGINEGSNLGLLDAMKRRLDAVGRVAARAGDDDSASQATALARRLRDMTDQALDSPAYARARSLRQDAYRVDEAFDAGAEMAASRLPLDVASRARGGANVQGPLRKEVGQGYAAELAEAVLNRRGTPDALNRLSAPLQREAMVAALGSGAKRVEQQLATEKVFGETHRALTGNSTTARQLKEMGAIAGAGTGLGILGGLDIQQAGVAGVTAALLKRGGGAAVTRLRAGNEEKVAQEIAKILIARGVPTTPKGVSVALQNPERNREIARILAGMGGASAGSN